ncbi:MAG: hypothetical protein SXG53_07595 [Pseudomonadota bacterium]|nr:hypothetical protein [Pseudomonadota bacterium]
MIAPSEKQAYSHERCSRGTPRPVVVQELDETFDPGSTLLTASRLHQPGVPTDSHNNRPQRIVRERHQYNQWAATQTLEDYALRYNFDLKRYMNVLETMRHDG